mgnify:CR=1 FL=1
MAGRSFLRRLLGDRSAVELDGSTAPSPGGFTPVPYPNATDGDGPEPTAFDEADAVFGTRTEVSRSAEVAPTVSTPAVDADDLGVTDLADASAQAETVTQELGDAEPDSPDIAGPSSSLGDDHEEIVGRHEIISPNNVIDGTDDGSAGEGPSSSHRLAEPIDGDVARDPAGSPVPIDKEEPIDAAPDRGDLSEKETVSTDLDEGTADEHGIIPPNNVVADPDDDIVLADLSGGSIEDQLTANTGFSPNVAEFGLDDLDGPDDADVD